MAVYSATRLRVRSPLKLPWFLWRNERVIRQVQRSPGLVGAEVLADRYLTFWTLSVWETWEAMREFRNSGAHKIGMPKLAGWCSEATTVSWEGAERAMPDWPQVYQRMRTEGREFPVRRPTPGFRAADIPAPHTSRLRRRHFKPKR